MVYQSESALENKLIEQLVGQGYEWVPEVNSEATMIANFRAILETRNSANLAAEPLTDTEFNRLMTQINGKSVFDSAKILRDKVLLKCDDGWNQVDVVNKKVDYKLSDTEETASQLVFISKIGPAIIKKVFNAWNEVIGQEMKLKN